MSDPTSSPTYTYNISVLGWAAGATTPALTTWQVTGSFVETRGEVVVVTDAAGNVLALAPYGAVVVRNDALAAGAPVPGTGITS